MSGPRAMKNDHGKSDTGFEPVTSSVSGQNLCSGMWWSVASGACAGSLMSATVRLGWPTLWPTVHLVERLQNDREQSSRPRVKQRWLIAVDQELAEHEVCFGNVDETR